MSQIPPPPGQMPPGMPPGQMPYQSPSPGASQGLAIGSLVCGILAILSFCVWWISIPLAIVAVVLAVLARGKIARGEAGGAGLAKAGLILGIIGGVLSILFIGLAIVGITMFGDKIQEMQRQQQMQQQQQGTSQELVAPVAR